MYIFFNNIPCIVNRIIKKKRDACIKIKSKVRKIY